MPNPFQWGPFLLFAIASSVTPGPNVIMLTSSGSTWGYLKSLPHLLGVCFGFPLMLLVVQLGAGFVFESMPWMFPLLTILSLAYVLWLSMRIFRMGFKEKSDASPVSRPMTFMEAVLFQWINGKAWQIVLMVAALFPSDDLSTKILCAMSFIGILFACGSGWIELGKKITQFLESPAARKGYYSILAASVLLSTFPTGISQLWRLFDG